MHYDIKLGFLAAEAISAFSRGASATENTRYDSFLARCAEYCKEVKKTYGHPVEADILATMPDTVADFMRAVIKTQQPSPTITAKLEAVGSLEALLIKIRDEQRHPSDDECLRIAKTVYATSAADPR